MVDQPKLERIHLLIGHSHLCIEGQLKLGLQTFKKLVSSSEKKNEDKMSQTLKTIKLEK